MKYEVIRVYKTRDFTYYVLSKDGKLITVGKAVFKDFKEKGKINEAA